MSLALSGDTVAYMMGLGLDAEQMRGLIDRLQRDALAMAPPAALNGINEETEHLRNASTYAERKRKKDRDRQRMLREAARQSRDVAGGSRDVAGDVAATEGDRGATPRDTAPSRTGAQVVTPSLPSLRSEEVGGGGVGAREPDQPTDDWPAGKASDHAAQLVEFVASPWLDPQKSPDLVTTRGRVAAWKRDGASWEHDVLPVVTGLCANRRARISSWKFFDAAVSRSIADNRAALEIPEAGTVVPFRATGPPSYLEQQTAINAEARRRVLEGD